MGTEIGGKNQYKDLDGQWDTNYSNKDTDREKDLDKD